MVIFTEKTVIKINCFYGYFYGKDRHKNQLFLWLFLRELRLDGTYYHCYNGSR